MENKIKILTLVMMAIAVVMGVLFLILIWFYYKNQRDKNKEEEKEENKPVPVAAAKTKTFTVEKVDKFMEFETVMDDMIVQKANSKYLMIVECQGINYDLMSEEEKNGVEAGFIQFLNTIRYPIQLYIQTRTINLEKSILKYKENVDAIENEFNKERVQYDEAIKNGRMTKSQMDVMYYELVKHKNLLDYGRDIISATERMSTNRNVLSKKYYVVIPYYVDGLSDGRYSSDERLDMAFSELYTRSQAIISSLATCGIVGRILNSEEVSELLYIAYNRDQAETYDMDRAIRAQYNQLYSTAEDVMKKKIKTLDKRIVEEGKEKIYETIERVRFKNEQEYKEKLQNKQEYIDAFAEDTIMKNSRIIGNKVAVQAVKEIENEKQERKKENN